MLDIFYSFLLGLGISFILILSPIIAGLFGRLVYGVYIGFALGIAAWAGPQGLGIPAWPYVLISIIAAINISNSNAQYSKNAMSAAPERAAGALASFVIFLIIGLIYRLL